MATNKAPIVVSAVAALALAAGVGGWFYSIRETDAHRRETLNAVKAEFAACKPEQQLPFLEKLATETALRYCVSADTNAPSGFITKTRVPVEAIADLAEKSLAVQTKLDDGARKLLAFADGLANSCPSNRADVLRAHCTEQLFKAKDLDGALDFMSRMGTTPAAAKIVRKQIALHLRGLARDGIIPFLGKFVASPYFRTTDYIAQLTEDQFLRFAGDGQQVPADVAMLKNLLAFSSDLLKDPRLSKSGAVTLSERRLDGFFLSNDFDGAISLLETSGLPNRSPAWQKATAAKLRAHKAQEAKDWKEASKQMLIFIDFMLSDEQKDFEDCDPTTGIVYSREWVVARNYLRCAQFMKDAGDAAKSAAYRDLAGTFFKTALTKAKEDKSSLDVLVKEMKDNNFPVDLPAEEKPAPKAEATKAAEAK